ncbi:MAG: DNA repair protein RadA, partial [Lachnospiraceae bacterium]|nr:DNA repair protein RadA [Lachnospiraceae bacterium]
SDQDAYVNIAGGIKISEPAVDLGIVMAIVSSYRNKAIDDKTIAFGEVGLSGEVRAVSQAAARVSEAKKLGFETCIVPYGCIDSLKDIKGIKIVGVKNIAQAIETI